MVDKKGNFNFADFDLDKAYDMIDDKTAKRVAEDIRKHLGPNGLQPHKPVVTGPGGAPVPNVISQARAQVHGLGQRSVSKD